MTCTPNLLAIFTIESNVRFSWPPSTRCRYRRPTPTLRKIRLREASLNPEFSDVATDALSDLVGLHPTEGSSAGVGFERAP